MQYIDLYVDGEPITVKYIKPASKGDTIFGVWGQWLIAVNLPWGTIQVEDSDEMPVYTIHAKTIKRNEERRYSLIKIERLERRYIRKREVVEHVNPEIIELHGLRIKTGGSIIYDVYEKVEEIWNAEKKTFEVVNVKETNRIKREGVKTTFEIVEENEITKLIEKATHFWLTDITKGIQLMNYLDVKLNRFKEVDESILLELSKYYVIAYPFFSCEFEGRDGEFCIYHVYYDGSKFEIPLTSFKDPKPLYYRITRRRFALPDGVKRKLPFGGLHYDVEEFVDTIFECYLAVKGVKVIQKPIFDVFRSKEISVELKKLDNFDRFLEIFYVRTPKRKFKAVEPYFKVYDRLREILKDEPVMYIAFPNKKEANYGSIRVQGDKFSVSGIPQVGITAICVKGAFEEAYKIVHGLKKLLRYQFASKAKKIEMIREDIEELRRWFEKEGYDVRDMHPAEIQEKLFKLAEGYEGDNLALILYKARDLDHAPDSVTLLKIAGLIKSGRDYDYTLDRFEDILKYMRIAVKYEIKKRGYSPRMGVIFTGSPREIINRVLETVERVKTARLRSLLADMISGNEDIDKRVSVKVGRLKALLKVLS